MQNDLPQYLACQHGARVIDVRQARSQIVIAIDGPGMSVSHLELVTSLSMWQGHDVAALRAIAKEIDVQVQCGHKPDSSVTVVPVQTALGPILRIDVGPMGMYTSKLMLKTRSGNSFQELLDRCFALHAESGLNTTDYIAVLLVVAGKGHRHRMHSKHLQSIDAQASDHNAHEHREG